MLNTVVCETITGGVKEVLIDDLVFRPAAYGVVVRGDDILLVNTKSSGKWFFPGGAIEKGEKSFEGLERELLEETGCIVDNISFLTIKETFFYYEPLDGAYQSLSLIYTACQPPTFYNTKFSPFKTSFDTLI